MQDPNTEYLIAIERLHGALEFVDVVGSTAIAKKLKELAGDDEPFGRYISRLDNYIEEIAQGHGCSFIDFLGDGVLLVWKGTVREPQLRAVRTAWDIAQRFTELDSDDRFLKEALGPVYEGCEEDLLDLFKPRAKIGMSYGEVMFRYAGRQTRKHTVLADEANLAARLQQNVVLPEGEFVGILVDERIREATKDEFDYQSRELDLKGIGRVKGHRLVGKKAKRFAKLGLTHVHRKQAFVGREQEYRFLSGFDWQEKKRLAVTGEPGIGKTLLAETFLAREKMPCYRFKADDVGQRPLQLLKSILSDYLDISQADTQAERAAKLSERTGQAGIDSRYIGYLLGIEGERIYLNPQELRERVFADSLALLKAQYAREPFTLFIDDLQWLDSDSHDWLAYLEKGSEITVLATARPGYGMGDFETLALERLPKGDLYHIAESLLDRIPSGLEPAVQAAIQDADGNPFYLKGLLLALREPARPLPANVLARLREGEAEIPSAISEKIISSTCDTDFDRDQLIAISVLGRRFRRPVLEKVLKRPAELEQQLQKGIINQVGLDEYTLTHKLFESVFYRIIAGTHDEARLNLRAARAYEASFPEEHETLVRYWSRALGHKIVEDEIGPVIRAKAVGHLQKAAERARALYANKQVVEYYSRAIEILDQDLGVDSEIKKAELLFERAKAYMVLNDKESARQDFERVENIGSLTKAGGLEAEGLDGLGALARGEDFDDALALLQKAARIAEKTGNEEILGNIYNEMGVAYQMMVPGTEPQEAGELLRSALKFNLRSKRIFKRFDNKLPLAKAYGNIGNICFFRGNYNKAAESHEQAVRNYSKAAKFHEKAVRIKEEIGDIGELGTSLISLGTVLERGGDLQRGLDCTLRGLDYLEEADKRKYQINAHINLAIFYSKLAEGEPDESARQQHREYAAKHDSRAEALIEEMGGPDHLKTLMLKNRENYKIRDGL